MIIWAGIVIYNPQLERFIENYERIEKHVDGVILFNNGCDDRCKEYINSLSKDKMILIDYSENVGIAAALNGIFEEAQKQKAEWVITLDQDSITPNNLVEEFKNRIIKSDRELAILSPKIIDRRRIYPSNKVVEVTTDDKFVEMCITSGSCTRVSAWKKIGGFDEILFIDLVDNDFCKRLGIDGWKILRMNSVELDQEFGNIYPRNEKTTAFFKFICKRIPNQNLAVKVSKLAYKKNVSVLRVYYTNRNIIYLNNKFVKYGGIGYSSYCANSYLGFFIGFNLPSILRSKEKRSVLRAIKNGIRDGKLLINNK